MHLHALPLLSDQYAKRITRSHSQIAAPSLKLVLGNSWKNLHVPERDIEALLNKTKLPHIHAFIVQERWHIDLETAVDSEHAKTFVWKIVRGAIVRIGGRFCPCQSLRPNMRWTPRLWRSGWPSGQLDKPEVSHKKSLLIGAKSIVLI